MYETEAGNSRWRLVGGNGEEVANGGENFSSHWSANRAAEGFRDHVSSHTFEVYESGSDYRWRAKASNGQTVASSGEPFPSRSLASTTMIGRRVEVTVRGVGSKPPILLDLDGVLQQADQVRTPRRSVGTLRPCGSG